MFKTVAGIVAGLIVWFVVATIVNLGFRAFWPAYAQVESAMNFTLAMQFARLALGALSSLCAGFVAAWITRANGKADAVLGKSLAQGLRGFDIAGIGAGAGATIDADSLDFGHFQHVALQRNSVKPVNGA